MRRLTNEVAIVAVLGVALACTPEAKTSADISPSPPVTAALPAPAAIATSAPPASPPEPSSLGGYAFVGGYPTPDTIRRAYDEADLNRALQCYRFFYPSVSITATWKGNLKAGAVPNKVFALLEGTPQQLVFTPNSDTP